MNVSKLSRRSIGRLSLEKAALKEVCSCQFFDLQNSLGETSSLELLQIIRHDTNCASCGRKGARGTNEHPKSREAAKPLDFGIILQYVKYFLENLDYLLLKQIDAVQKANFFGLIFNESPTYGEIESGITNPGKLTGINELFKLKNIKRSLLVGQSR